MDEMQNFDEELVKMAAAMPQFDVPEELTQKILAAAELEGIQRKPRWQSIAALTALVLGFIAVLCMDSFESVWGLMSWLLCVPAMFALQALIAAPQGQEHGLR